MADQDKFEEVELPKILAALHNAKESKMASEVTVIFSKEGGVLDIRLKSEKRFK